MTKKEDKQIIYIGDSIGSLLKQDTVFIGGIPNNLNELLKEKPLIKNLFVDLNELVDKKKKLKVKGTLEYLSNLNIKEDK